MTSALMMVQAASGAIETYLQLHANPSGGGQVEFLHSIPLLPPPPPPPPGGCAFFRFCLLPESTWKCHLLGSSL